MTKRKIAVVTGTRAEYGLLYRLLCEIKNDPTLELQLIVTGMHLSPEFGLTYKEIELDGFTIDAKIEMLISSDTATGTAKSIGLGVIGISDVLSRLQPDVIVLLGDRFEALAVAQTALVHHIPVAHIHGGELSEGAIDDAIRHAISKMSHLHFVAAEPYRKRIIQLGENPNYIFNVGAPGLERISKAKLLSLDELENKINFKLGKINFLVVYHPVTLEIENNLDALENLFAALDVFPEAKIIFSKANADESGRIINAEIDKYIAKHGDKHISYMSLGDLTYISLLRYVDIIIGNSSSGIIEAPYFSKPAINIGNRQAKRLRSKTVIDTSAEKEAIIAAIKKGLSDEFKAASRGAPLAYGQDNTAEKIKNILKTTNLEGMTLKAFHDLNW